MSGRLSDQRRSSQIAVGREFLSSEVAWRAAHIGEDFQAERWGADAQAMARREARWRQIEAAAIIVAMTRLV